MDTTQAIKILKSNGWKVEVIDRKKYRVKHFRWEDYEDHTARELITLARCYTHDNKQTNTVNKNTKHQNNSKTRASTREAIQSERFDDIPINGHIRQGDRWNWD